MYLIVKIKKSNKIGLSFNNTKTTVQCSKSISNLGPLDCSDVGTHFKHYLSTYIYGYVLETLRFIY